MHGKGAGGAGIENLKPTGFGHTGYCDGGIEGDMCKHTLCVRPNKEFIQLQKNMFTTSGGEGDTVSGSSGGRNDARAEQKNHSYGPNSTDGQPLRNE